MSLRRSNNLYLHYLDRELRDAVSCTLSEGQILRALLASLCLTPGLLFCSYSHLWESHSILANSIGLLRDCINSGLLIPASNQRSAAEFLSTRQILYAHDTKRYPLYFQSKKSKEIQALEPGFPTSGGATKKLEHDLRSLTLSKPTNGLAANDSTIHILQAGLKDRGDRAITGALFEPYSAGNGASIMSIRRSISESYTRHYMDECLADIMTGVPRLGQFDHLGKAYPLYDVAVFESLLGSCYKYPLAPGALRQLLVRAIESHGTSEHSAFLTQYERILRICAYSAGHFGRKSVRPGPVTGEIIAELKRRTETARTLRMEKFSYGSLGNILLNIEKSDSGRDRLLADFDEATVGQKKIVLLLATDSEWQAANEAGLNLNPIQSPKVSAWSGNDCNGYNLLVVRSEMGTQSAGAATLVTNDVIKLFRPAYVIMAGIAFGTKQSTQKMCDILVASRVVDYETAKVTPTAVDSRGVVYASSPELLAKARQVGAERKDVHVGEIICGCKVVNDPTFLKSLIERYPNAIGGEMEGIGLASACHRESVPWILVKAICDWGKIKTDDHQLDAARKSIAYCLEIVNLMPSGGG